MTSTGSFKRFWIISLVGRSAKLGVFVEQSELFHRLDACFSSKVTLANKNLG